jgi:hypothetical protein
VETSDKNVKKFFTIAPIFVTSRRIFSIKRLDRLNFFETEIFLKYSKGNKVKRFFKVMDTGLA